MLYKCYKNFSLSRNFRHVFAYMITKAKLTTTTITTVEHVIVTSLLTVSIVAVHDIFL